MNNKVLTDGKVCKKQNLTSNFYDAFRNLGQNWPLGRSDLFLYLARFVGRAEKKRGMMSHQKKVTHTRVETGGR